MNEKVFVAKISWLTAERSEPKNKKVRAIGRI